DALSAKPNASLRVGYADRLQLADNDRLRPGQAFVRRADHRDVQAPNLVSVLEVVDEVEALDERSIGQDDDLGPDDLVHLTGIEVDPRGLPRRAAVRRAC